MRKATLCLAAFGLATAVAGTATVSQAETKLTYGSYLPAPHLVHKNGLEPMFKELEQATNGSLKFELFSGGAMGGGKAMLQIVRDRVTDSSIIIDAYVKRDLPASASITELAVIGEDNRVMAGAINELQLLGCKQCDKEQKRGRYKALAFYATSPYSLMCTSPISTLAELEGKKVRATSAFGVMMKELGATPVSITSSEIYEAMQRGQADCTVGSAAWLTSYSLKDVVTAILDVPLGTYHGALVYNMNMKTWRSLSSDERKAIIKAMPGLVSRIVHAYNDDSNAAIDAAKSGGGVEILAPGADLVARLDAHRKSEKARVVAKAEEAGVDDAEGMIDQLLALRDKWKGIVAETGDDPKKYEQALWDHVYSKLDPDA